MNARRFDRADAAAVQAELCLPVLALHGAASSGRQWDGLSGYLRGHYQVIAPNLPGYDVPRLIRPRDLRDAADNVIGALPDCGTVHVVGHSQGAALALEIAMRRPELVRSLTLIEPGVYHLLRGGDASDLALLNDLASLADWMTASVAACHPAAGMRAYVDFWYGIGAWDRTGSVTRGDLMLDTERVASDLAASLAQSWPADRCERVACPTLAMMALESHVAGLRVTEIVAEAIPGAQLVMVPEAGHISPLTDPHITDPIVAAHLRFVDGVTAGDGSLRLVQ